MQNPAITSAAWTHVGRRDHNEDSHFCDASLGLHVVADGMGGYEGGEVASRIAIDVLRAFYRRNAQEDDVTWPFALDPRVALDENQLAVGLRMANAGIAAERKGKLRAMGSTVAALVLRGNRALIGHVGDSRVYRLRDGRLEALTRDHSLYEELKATGAKLGPKSEFPHANVITRALGMNPDVKVELRAERARAGDVFMLCTDGLLETMDDECIAAVLGSMPPCEAARELVDRAFVGGSRDNITVVVARIG